MRIEQKKKIAEELSRHLQEAGIIYLTDFTGLDVASMTELRDRLAERGLRYRVVKNTLMRRALEGLDLPDIEEHLRGPTGLVMGDDDPVVPAKAVSEFAREHDERPVVKIGIVERRVVGRDEVGALAELPPRDQLLGSIAGSLTAGVGGIAGALEALLRDIAHMIGEIGGRERNSPRKGAEA